MLLQRRPLQDHPTTEYQIHHSRVEAHPQGALHRVEQCWHARAADSGIQFIGQVIVLDCDCGQIDACALQALCNAHTMTLVRLWETCRGCESVSKRRRPLVCQGDVMMCRSRGHTCEPRKEGGALLALPHAQQRVRQRLALLAITCIRFSSSSACCREAVHLVVRHFIRASSRIAI